MNDDFSFLRYEYDSDQYMVEEAKYLFPFSVLPEDRHMLCQMMPNPLLVPLHFSVSGIAARLGGGKDVCVER